MEESALTMTMVVPVEAVPVPIVMDAHGVIKIKGSRVTLETVLGAFKDGATAETIVQQYPTLQLGDVYAVVAYYLRDKANVDAYLDEQERLNEEVQRRNEERFPPDGIRERLLARKHQLENG